MEPEVGVSTGRDSDAVPRRRPSPGWVLRMVELTGLGLVMVGLATSRFWLGAVGAALVVFSYALYRWRHGASPPASNDGGSDAGSGGDSA